MIIKAIDTYLETRPSDERPIRCFHPSSLHRPPRDLYWHYLKGDHRAFDARTLRIFDNGHHVHDRLQGYLREAGILIQAEVPVANEEYEIRGHTDGIIEIHGIRGILEIKSMNARNFHSAYEPKPEHLVQVNVYMFCAGVSRACLLYECKDDQALKEFFLRQDPAILDPVLEKIRYVQDCIKKGTEPT
jgi:hypothetical protein